MLEPAVAVIAAASNNVTNDPKLRNDLERTPVPQADFLPMQTPSEALAAADNSLFYEFAQTLAMGFLDEESRRTD